MLSIVLPTLRTGNLFVIFHPDVSGASGEESLTGLGVSGTGLGESVTEVKESAIELRESGTVLEMGGRVVGEAVAWLRKSGTSGGEGEVGEAGTGVLQAEKYLGEGGHKVGGAGTSGRFTSARNNSDTRHSFFQCTIVFSL